MIMINTIGKKSTTQLRTKLVPNIQNKGGTFSKHLFINNRLPCLDSESFRKFAINLISAYFYNFKVAKVYAPCAAGRTWFYVSKDMGLTSKLRHNVLIHSCCQASLRISYIRDMCILYTFKLIDNIWQQW